MKQIRNSVFETNSSSMHSLVVRSKDLIEGDRYFTQEEIRKEFGIRSINKEGFWDDRERDWYFGRHPFRILSSFIDKWKYAYASFVFDFDEDKIAKEDELWQTRYQGSKLKEQELIDILKEAVPEIKDFRRPDYQGTDDYMLPGWLKETGISLKEFLLNKQYIIICDGDEYCYWYGLEDNGLIDFNNIKEFPRFEHEDYLSEEV